MKPKLFGVEIWWYQTFLLTKAKLTQPTGHRISKVRKQQKKFQQLRFHSVRPNVSTYVVDRGEVFSGWPGFNNLEPMVPSQSGTAQKKYNITYYTNDFSQSNKGGGTLLIFVGKL